MKSFIDDTAGAVYDFLKAGIIGFCYLIAGMLIVGTVFFLAIVLIRAYSFFFIS